MDRPEWNTAPIRCGRVKCKWRGYEGQLSKKKDGIVTRSACPECGNESYMFMTLGEVKAWEKKKAEAARAERPTVQYELNEDRRPGLADAVKRIMAENPNMSLSHAVAKAKTEYSYQLAKP